VSRADREAPRVAPLHREARCIEAIAWGPRTVAQQSGVEGHKELVRTGLEAVRASPSPSFHILERDDRGADLVHFTVTSLASVRPGTVCLLDVWAHRERLLRARGRRPPAR
jgi:hypothetical protein